MLNLYKVAVLANVASSALAFTLFFVHDSPFSPAEAFERDMGFLSTIFLIPCGLLFRLLYLERRRVGFFYPVNIFRLFPFVLGLLLAGLSILFAIGLAILSSILLSGWLEDWVLGWLYAGTSWFMLEYSFLGGVLLIEVFGIRRRNRRVLADTAEQ